MILRHGGSVHQFSYHGKLNLDKNGQNIVCNHSIFAKYSTVDLSSFPSIWHTIFGTSLAINLPASIIQQFTSVL